jgi:hypothetical protein
MANTFTSLHYHVIFSTKNRERWLGTQIQERIWAYLAGIATTNNMNRSKLEEWTTMSISCSEFRRHWR